MELHQISGGKDGQVIKRYAPLTFDSSLKTRCSRAGGFETAQKNAKGIENGFLGVKIGLKPNKLAQVDTNGILALAVMYSVLKTMSPSLPPAV
jgi:hypothetical protein